jgi:hypothetical protein
MTILLHNLRLGASAWQLRGAYIPRRRHHYVRLAPSPTDCSQPGATLRAWNLIEWLLHLTPQIRLLSDEVRLDALPGIIADPRCPIRVGRRRGKASKESSVCGVTFRGDVVWMVDCTLMHMHMFVLLDLRSSEKAENLAMAFGEDVYVCVYKSSLRAGADTERRRVKA